MASAVITYLVWFFFGWAGLHHLYLGRLNQAIVWFVTLGGGCGVGWIRDIWKIPDYLEWCNGDKSVRLEYLNRATRNPNPKCSFFRLTGMVVMGFLTSTIFGALVPDFKDMLKTDPNTYLFLKYTFIGLLILGNAIGVYLVANIGELQCPMFYPFVTSLCITPILIGNNPSMGFTSFLTALVTWYKGLRWRPLNLNQRGRKCTTCKNFTVYIFVCTVWLSVLIGGIYFNGTVTVAGGEKVPVREAVKNFFKSDAWKQTKESLYLLFNVLRHEGFGRAWRDAMRVFDVTGEVNAYKVLALSQSATQDEITRHCRKLSATHHPDRFKTQTEKDSAQEKFIEIQHACSMLSSTLSRKTRNMKPPTEDNNN